MRVKKRYSLLIPWVTDAVHFAYTLSTTYFDSFDLIQLPLEGQKIRWRFATLYSLNNFWSQVLTFAINHSKDTHVYGWAPHNWYNLIKADNEQQYIESLNKFNVKQYLIIGDITPLDRFAEQFWDKNHVEFSTAQSLYHGKKSLYFDVVGDLIISLQLDSETTNAIESLYMNTLTIDALNVPEVFGLFHQKTKAVLILENNPKKAGLIRKRFNQYFG